jgi:hypothetical protein
MGLPKLNTITYRLVLPSNDKEITYRPFTVEEEKILLTAQESTDAKDIMAAMRQIINNCVQTELDVMKLPTFDIEYLFLNIRAKSTGEEIDLIVRHPNGINAQGEQCDHKEDVKINIESVRVTKPKNSNNNFQLDENVGVIMRYPTIESLAIDTTDNFDGFVRVVANSIETIYDKENTYAAEDVSEKELVEFVYSMNQKQIVLIQEFFENMPILKHDINYICTACGCKETVTIQGFQNFFS